MSDERSAGIGKLVVRLKLSLIDVCVIAMTVGLLAGILMPNGDQDRTHHYPPADPAAGNGLASLAGEYHQGASRGRYLSLSVLPDGRYSFVWGTCTGVHCRESGRVQKTGKLVTLLSSGPVGESIEWVFVPTRWGDRMYLVPPERMAAFCEAITGGIEPRSGTTGRFWLRFPAPRVEGVPELPQRWAAYLRVNLLIGKVVEVKRNRARIDLGSRDGLREGGRLNVQGDSDRHDLRLSVVSVEDGTCTVVDYEDGGADLSRVAGRKVVGRRGTGNDGR